MTKALGKRKGLSETSEETAARFAASYHSEEKIRFRALTVKHKRWMTLTLARRARLFATPNTIAPKRLDPPTRATDWTLLREMLIEHIARNRGAVMPGQLYQSIVDDYGSLNIRRFWRALRYLADEGIIERLPEGISRPRNGRRA